MLLSERRGVTGSSCFLLHFSSRAGGLSVRPRGRHSSTKTRGSSARLPIDVSRRSHERAAANRRGAAESARSSSHRDRKANSRKPRQRTDTKARGGTAEQPPVEDPRAPRRGLPRPAPDGRTDRIRPWPRHTEPPADAPGGWVGVKTRRGDDSRGEMVDYCERRTETPPRLDLLP